MRGIRKLIATIIVMASIFAMIPAGSVFAAGYTGWKLDDSGNYRYYVNDVMQTGWIQSKQTKKWYYCDPNNDGIMITDNYYSEGSESNWKLYYFDKTGAMVTNCWKIVDSGSYAGKTINLYTYFGSSGACVTGWKKISGKWYYFHPEEPIALFGGPFEIKGTTYVFGDDCALIERKGWYHCTLSMVFGPGDYWFYTNSDGTAVKGWKKISGKWYYFNPDQYGAMVTGIRKIGSETYAFASSGAMAANKWIEIEENTWAYASGSGAFVRSDWKYISGYWYYFDNSGIMVTDTVIDGWVIDENGHYVGKAE
ncbi:Glucan-binding domain-containing protein (YG repeat) [Ruminococcaceae bacterium YRB3002]|nr:Glucan-binding domain-containing protein (YG repeat) [Ruminococcaceae bacterium YRB3002]